MSLEKDYVVGKGKVYFNPFLLGTKTPTVERYLGNTPELSTTSDSSTLDHFDADSGLNVKDESVTIEQNLTGSLVTDHISLENVAMFFGGTVADTVVTAATAVVETHAAKLGRWIQLGTNALNPSGARAVAAVVITIAAAPVTMLNNYEVDAALGRIYIEPDAPGIEEDDALTITFNIGGSTRTQIVGSGSEVSGSLRFISFNPVGSQKDYFYPYVKLTANGDFALKGSEWMQIPFSFEVLKLDAATERVYIDARTVA